MNRIKSYITVVIGLFACLFVSCIKEDLSDCPPSGKQIQVLFTYEDGEINPDDLHEVTLFVFDEDNNFVTLWSLNAPLLDTVYIPEIKLAPGKYNLLTWFNAQAPYSITPAKNTLSRSVVKTQMELRLDIPSGGDFTDNLPLLLYGKLAGIAEVSQTGDNLFSIPLVQNINRINIKVTGLFPVTEDTYRFAITDNNGNYTFDNGFASTDFSENVFSYVTETSDTGGTGNLNASLTVLKLSGDRDNPELTIRDQTEEFYRCNLIQLIRQFYPANDYDKTHVYTIEIAYNGDNLTDVSVSVTIDDWYSDHSDHQIEP
jgi:hypothetical protein